MPPLLICLQQGQSHMKGDNPNYLQAKSPAEVKENEDTTAAIILFSPKQRQRGLRSLPRKYWGIPLII